MARPKTKIDPNKIKTRDHLMVLLINGATKAGIHKDKKKEENKKKSRKRVIQENESD